MSVITLHTPKVLVIDDALPPALATQVWLSLNTQEDFTPKGVLEEWTKVWHWTDQPPVTSVRSYWYSDSTTGKYPDVVGDLFLQAARAYPALAGSYKDLRIHSHLFGRGTRILLHRDGHSAGSFTYYPHPRWEPGWGGELLIPDVPAGAEVGEHPGARFGSGYHLPEMHPAMWDGGLFLAPRPNRLILLAPRAYHSVAAVSPDAGDNLRCSIVGFLCAVKPPPKPLTENPRTR